MTMPDGQTTVPAGDASPTVVGALSDTTQVAATTETQKPPEPSLEERVAAAVKAQIGPILESSKREIQSAKDKAAAEVRRAAEQVSTVQASNEALRRMVSTYDPEAAKTMELNELRAFHAEHTHQAAQISQFNSALASFREEMLEQASDDGVDPSRIEPYFQEVVQTGDFRGIAKKIRAEVKKAAAPTAAVIKAEVDKATKALKEELAALRKEYGAEVNGVDTSVAAGASGSGIPTNKAAFAKWYRELPDDKAKAMEQEINAALDSGRIK